MKDKEIKIKKPGRKPTQVALFQKLDSLDKGESLIITKKEWSAKGNPGMHLIRKRIGREFKVNTLADDSGWQCTALD